MVVRDGLADIVDQLQSEVGDGTSPSQAASPSRRPSSADHTSPEEQAPGNPVGLSAASLDGQTSPSIEPESSLQVLLRLASGARFFRSADGRHFAQVPVGSRHEVYGLKSAAFRDWLIEGYFADCREVPSQWALPPRSGLARGAGTVRGGHAVGLYSRRPRRLGERFPLLP